MPNWSLPGAITDNTGRRLLHFGGPIPEQRTLTEGPESSVVVDDSTVVYRLRGADRLTWLHSLTSQSLVGMQPGDSAETLILDPNGHVEHMLRLVEGTDETTWMLLHVGYAEAAVEWLNKMRFRADVSIEDASADVVTVSEYRAGSPARALLPVIATWVDPWGEVVDGGFSYANELPEWHRVVHLVPADWATSVSPLIADGSLKLAGHLAADALRIAAGRPEPTDFEGVNALPHEYDLLRTSVHLNKGCYRGQETVAKVFNVGRPPKRLVMLYLDGSDVELPAAPPPIPGVIEMGNPVGWILAAAHHYELGPIALAVLLRKIDPTSEVFLAGGGFPPMTATQQEIVPANAGPQVDVPKLPRLRPLRPKA